MNSWRTVVAVALTLGLAATPLLVRAEDEEGVRGEHQAHHETTSEPTPEGMKKETQPQGEAKKAGAPDEGTSAAPQGVQGSDLEGEETEEGSH